MFLEMKQNGQCPAVQDTMRCRQVVQCIIAQNCVVLLQMANRFFILVHCANFPVKMFSP
jgi:hypothetical protein